MENVQRFKIYNDTLLKTHRTLNVQNQDKPYFFYNSNIAQISRGYVLKKTLKKHIEYFVEKNNIQSQKGKDINYQNGSIE